MLRFFASALVATLFTWQVFAQVTNHAVCTTALWTNNARGQSPCLVYSYLMYMCYPGGFDLYDPPYHGPRASQSNNCWCSSVSYNVLAACSYCQSAPFMSWTTYSQNCSASDIARGAYREDIHPAISVPAWAYFDPANYNNEWNATASQALALQNVPDITVTPTSTRTSRTSSSSSSTSRSSSASTSTSTSNPILKKAIQVIIGVVVGVVVFIVAFIVGCCCLFRRRRQASGAQPTTAFTPAAPMSYQPVSTGPPTPASGYYGGGVGNATYQGDAASATYQGGGTNGSFLGDTANASYQGGGANPTYQGDAASQQGYAGTPNTYNPSTPAYPPNPPTFPAQPQDYGYAGYPAPRV